MVCIITLPYYNWGTGRFLKTYLLNHGGDIMEAIVKANWYSKNDKYLNNPHLTCQAQEWSTSILVVRQIGTLFNKCRKGVLWSKASKLLKL